jgi:hypothetical protein
MDALALESIKAVAKVIWKRLLIDLMTLTELICFLIKNKQTNYISKPPTFQSDLIYSKTFLLERVLTRATQLHL